jgi:hypothetical protein
VGSVPWWSTLIGLFIGWTLREMSESLRAWRTKRQEARDRILAAELERKERQKSALRQLRDMLPTLHVRDPSELELALVDADPLDRTTAWQEWERDFDHQKIRVRDLAEDLEDAGLRETVCRYVALAEQDSALLESLIRRLGAAMRSAPKT